MLNKVPQWDGGKIGGVITGVGAKVAALGEGAVVKRGEDGPGGWRAGFENGFAEREW